MEAQVVIIGGGVAGLTIALELAKAQVDVLLIERHSYPSHKVCGEYVSNEVRPYLETIGLNPVQLGAAEISRLTVSSPLGKKLNAQLASGGFGLSRYALDHALYQLCLTAGVRFLLNTSVSKVEAAERGFLVSTNVGGALSADLVVGAYGKKSALDVKAFRAFTQKKSPYLAVKYHIRFEHERDLISLHNFDDGYCGISAVEDGKSCLCYLTTRANLRKTTGDIRRMESEILGRNPHLNRIFSEAEFLFDKPLVINDISFAKKSAAFQGMLMTGDSAGLITPLCGNGMAMGISSARILSSLLVRSLSAGVSRELQAKEYEKHWAQAFGGRIKAGRMIQAVFGNEWVTEAVVSLLRFSPALTGRIIQLTHGKPIA